MKTRAWPAPDPMHGQDFSTRKMNRSGAIRLHLVTEKDTSLDWPPPTTPWLCTTVSNLPAILDARLWKDGTATVKCGMDTATEKFQVCMTSKLPRVVPTRTRSGLVHDLGTRSALRRWPGHYREWYQSKFPAIQFHSSAASTTVLTARLRWHSEEWRRSYASSIGPKEWLHDMGFQILSCRDVSPGYACSRRLVKEARARCLGIGYLEKSLGAIMANRSDLRSESVVDKLSFRYDMMRS
ncbi:hypothetical protein TIFTF001_018828 [Ficus carica]|uniref:Uncharacterized protein n=1 Tax=Ficus carica TaxID=3494 RepID=A0AA88AVY8_FICCA|nr:hypothetical protein TIFTF001_018828 [Ficus carica]